MEFSKMYLLKIFYPNTLLEQLTFILYAPCSHVILEYLGSKETEK